MVHPKADRVFRHLQVQFPTLKRSHLEEALKARLVVGERNQTLKKGDLVLADGLNTKALAEHLKTLSQGKLLPLPVLFETAEFWIVDKPPGIQSQPLSLFDVDTVSHWALAKDPKTLQEFPDPQPEMAPHRLDTGTSGLLIVAKTAKSFGEWRRRFQSKKITKTYLAWVWGRPTKKEWVMRHELAHSTGEPHHIVVVGEKRHRPPIMEAESHASLVRAEQGLSLVKVRCETGATHQVRVQLAAHGLPLVGDTLYDKTARPFQTPHHLLRAVKLECEGEVWEVSTEAFSKTPTAMP